MHVDEFWLMPFEAGYRRRGKDVEDKEEHGMHSK